MAASLNVKRVCSLLLVTFTFLAGSHGDRIAEKIYKRIDGGFSCFRRLNGTGQTGCSSASSGNVGVVHFAESDSDLQWLIDVGPNAPYVVLLTPDLFRRESLTKLEESGKITGVVVLNSTSSRPSAPHSNDLTCPNKLTGLYNSSLASVCDSNPWNPGGDGLLFENIGYPIFFINESSFNQSSLVNDCFLKFNQPVNGTPPSYPLCAIELKAFMWAAVDTPTCLRRGQLNTMSFNPQPSEFCDPLGDVNIYVPLLAANKSDGPVRNRSVIFISARMDSSSMFDGLAVGADTAITGLITLVTVAEMLNKVKDNLRGSGDVDNVFVVLFNGEAFDYIGSSRMAYDMNLGKFPRPLVNDTPSQVPLIGLEHIKYWIELGSLAPTVDSTVYLHTDPISTGDSAVSAKVRQIEEALKNNSGNLRILSTDTSTPLPPASLQSFLKKDLGIPGVLIANHRNAFVNQFYNSEWDTFESINTGRLSKHLADVARSVAAAVYQLASGDKMSASIQANQTLVDKCLECYLMNANCSFFNWLLNGRSNMVAEGILPTYVGVSHSDEAVKPLSVRTRNILALVSGEELEINKTACFASDNDEIYRFYWMGETESNNASGACYKTTVKTSVAVSPAFIIEDYNWTSGAYSSWTESRWETFSTRIFLKPSKTQEISVFVLGVFVLIFSFLATYWMDAKASLLFSPCSSDGVAC